MSDKRMHVLHVKRHTEGTSNELSLSVLEAKKNAADAATGTTVQSAFDADVEIKRRKHKRKTLRVVNVIVSVVLVVAAIGFGGSYWYKQSIATKSVDATLDEALGLIERSDDVVVSMDEVLNASVDDAALDTMKDLIEKSPLAESYLDRAMNKVQEAESVNSSDALGEKKQRIIDDINARGDLIEKGKTLMNADVSAKRALNALEQAHEYVLIGDSLAVDAAKLVANTTEENVSASVSKSNQAIEQFQAARKLLNDAKSYSPNADLQLYYDYLNARIQAQQYALESDDAITRQNRAEAESNNNLANETEKEAAALAQGFPDVFSQPVLDAYEKDTEQDRSAYDDARSRAALADAYLRDYLGASHK